METDSEEPVINNTFINEDNKIFLQAAVNKGDISVIHTNAPGSNGGDNRIVMQAGVNYGNILNIIPRKAENKIKKINYDVPLDLPFSRNRNFTGREEELAAIGRCFGGCFSASACGSASVVCALTGIGGMGKTQIAIEYAYACRDAHHLTSVFWVTAANEEAIRTSFVNIMQRIVQAQAKASWPESLPDYKAIGFSLGIPGLVDKDGNISFDPETINDIQTALFKWFNLPGNCKWLLIFDNADDLSFGFDKYLPNHGGGAVLVTSRRPEFLHCAEQIKLDGLDKNSAVRLLLRLAQVPASGANEQHAVIVVEKLGFMPLAISHAGCFIHQMNIGVDEYLKYYDNAFREAQSEVPRVGWAYGSETVVTTWEVSFLEVQKRNETAASLLLACSYLNSNEIFEALWEHEFFDMRYQVQQKRKFSLLASYSLITRNKPGAFSVHPVVHDWARERVDYPNRPHVMGGAISAIKRAIRLKELSDLNSKWDGGEERKIMAHADVLYKHLESRLDEVLEQEENEGHTLDTLGRIATIFQGQGKHEEALKQHRKVLAEKEKALGWSDLSTLATAHNIASIFNTQGRYSEALEQYQKVLASRETLLASRSDYGAPVAGQDHVLNLETIHNIAGTLFNLGRYNESLEQYRRALAGKEKYLGPNHPSTHDSLEGVALILQNQGKYDEAIKQYQKILSTLDGTPGSDNPSTLVTVHNLATAFEKQHKYDQALKYFQRALDGKEKGFGEDHPSTLATVHSMALAYHHQGDYIKSLEFYNRALSGREKVLGKNHPDTLTTAGNIAAVFKSQGMYEKALELYKRALSGCEKELGPDHPRTLTAIQNIASVLHFQQKYTESFEQYQIALAGNERTLGETNPLTLTTVHNIGTLFHTQRKYTEALHWYLRALAGRETLGLDHPDTLATVNCIALLFSFQGKYKEAEKWYSRALAGYQKTLGPDHQLTLSAARDLALASRKQNKFYLLRHHISNFSNELRR